MKLSKTFLITFYPILFSHCLLVENKLEFIIANSVMCHPSALIC